MSVTEHSSTALPAAIDALGSDSFSAALLEFVRAAADFDSAVIMAYPESGSLNVLHNALHEGDQSGFGGAYLTSGIGGTTSKVYSLNVHRWRSLNKRAIHWLLVPMESFPK